MKKVCPKLEQKAIMAPKQRKRLLRQMKAK
jgi:hypothetical protein